MNLLTYVRDAPVCIANRSLAQSSFTKKGGGLFINETSRLNRRWYGAHEAFELLRASARRKYCFHRREISNLEFQRTAISALD